MARWWRKVKEILLLLNKLDVQINIALVFIYVDDFRLGLTTIPYGYQYNPKTRQWSFSQDMKDQELLSKMTPEQKTKEALLIVMNSISRDLNFTVESKEDFPDLHLPTLDTKLRLLYNPDGTADNITYTFYEKDMNTRYTTIETTAQPQKDIIQALSQEVVRRLSRTDQTRPQTELNMILDNYGEKLIRSGFSINQVRLIMTSGIRCFTRKLMEAEQLNLPFYRKMTCPKARLQRKIKKHSDKTQFLSHF